VCLQLLERLLEHVRSFSQPPKAQVRHAECHNQFLAGMPLHVAFYTSMTPLSHSSP
jgi:hypothetical protein